MKKEPTFLVAAALFFAANGLFGRTVFPKSLPSPTLASLADSIPPVIGCPSNTNLGLGPGECTATLAYTVTATDNLPGVTVQQTTGLPSGGAFPIGYTYNNFKATDAAGNTATCSFTVSVQGYVPVFQCASGRNFALGPSCDYTVQVLDILTNQDLGCPANFTVELDRAAPYGNGPWAKPAILNALDLGKTLGVRVLDPQSGEKCTTTITVSTTVAPTLHCTDITVSCAAPSTDPAFLRDSLGFTWLWPTLQVNCANATISPKPLISALPFPCDSPFIKVIKNRWTATDMFGNTGTCVQSIFQPKVTLDNVLFPPNLTLSCQNADLGYAKTGKPFVLVGNFKSTDLCTISTSSEDSIVHICGASFKIFRKWQALDWCAFQSIFHVQTIDVQDVSPPQIACPANLTVTANASPNCRATMDLPDAVLVDNCSGLAEATAFWGTNDSLSASLENFAQNELGKNDTLAVFGLAQNLAVGQNTIQLRATDECGNRSSCQFALTVRDGVPPTANCKKFYTLNLPPDGLATLPAAFFNNGSADNCAAQLGFKIRRVAPNACQPNNYFFDEANFCCSDIGDTVDMVFKTFDFAPPAGPVSENFGLGQSATCDLRVFVRDPNPLGCIAPPSITVNCQQFDPTLAAHSQGFSQTCTAVPSMTQLFTDDSQFSWPCTAGTLKRTWQVTATNGATRSCVQTIKVIPLDSAAQRNFWVRFPDDLILFGCTADSTWGAPLIHGPTCAGFKIDHLDVLYTVVPDACFKVERTWTIKNTCIAGNAAPNYIPNPEPNAVPYATENLAGPTLSPPGTPAPWAPTVSKLTPSGNPVQFSGFWNTGKGGYVYKQIIKVIDTQKPTLTGCPATSPHFQDTTANDPQLWNSPTFLVSPDKSEGTVELSLDAEDCTWTTDFQVNYLLYLDVDGNTQYETVVNSTNVLPGQVLFDNWNTPNFAGGTVADFDNRPLAAGQKRRFALQKTSLGAGKMRLRVAWNTLDNPDQFEPIQLPTGKHRIKWFVSDYCGNQGTCTHDFTVSPTAQAAYLVSGQVVRAAKNLPMPNVTVPLSWQPFGTSLNQSTAQPTDGDGQFNFLNIPPLANYQLAPVYAADPLNGVSTYDLLLIQKHILGVDTLDSPFKLIAADANESGSITTFDILELRKLILGIYSNLKHSWRFVPASWAFDDPADPFHPPFPEQLARMQVAENHTLENFVGIKVGDVNESAAPNFSGDGEERAGEAKLDFEVSANRRQWAQGDTLAVKFAPNAPAETWQFTLEHPGLELLDILPGKNSALDHFGVFPETQTLTVAEFGPAANDPFSLIFKVLEKNSGAQNLRLNSRITRNEAVLRRVKTRAALHFLETPPGQIGQLSNLNLRVSPNPTRGDVQLDFWLKNPSPLRLTVADPLGKVLIFKNLQGNAGANVLRLTTSELGGATGVFVAKIETDGGSAAVKFVREAP